MLLLSQDMNVISDEELLLLLEENTSKNLEFSYGLYKRFHWNEIPEPECTYTWVPILLTLHLTK